MALFAIFGMWETTLAVAAGAASIPIIIHLLNRRRFRIVTWAAMKFLLAAQKQNTRKMRLEQLLLLAVRTLLVLLVILAMASVMPWAENVWAHFFPEGGPARPGFGGRTHRILVLDGSLSTNLLRENERKTGFEEGRRLAQKLVEESHSGDGFSVLLMKESPVWLVGEASQDRARVAKEIAAARPAHGNAALPAALNAVAAKLAEGSGRFNSREVYFFTDLQQTTWQALPPAEDKTKEGTPRIKNALEDIKNHARTIFIDVGRDNVPNLAVTDLRLQDSVVTTGSLVTVSAVVHNFGNKKFDQVPIELWLGRAKDGVKDEAFSVRSAGRQLENLGSGEQKLVNFGLRVDKPGTYAVQVRLGKSQTDDGDRECDDLAVDNARTVIVTVRETVPVLLVNGRPAADPFEKATEYLRLSLNPFAAGSMPKWAPIRPKEVSVAQFAEINESDLLAYDCIYLCDVGQLASADVRRFDMHLRRGGGLVVAVGDRAADQLETLDRLLFKNGQGLLPAKLTKKVAAPAEHHFRLHAADEAFLEPPLKAFTEDADRASLRTSRFRQYLQAKVADSARAHTVLSFMPEIEPGVKVERDASLPIGDPALIEWNPPLPKGQEIKEKTKLAGQAGHRYRGKVILFTSTFNMDWTTWPGSPSFGAMMQELVRLAVAGRLREHAVLVGQLLEEFLPAQGAELDVELHYPEGSGVSSQKSRTQLVDEANLFRSADTDLSGIYRLTVAREPQEHLFAVNFPSTTSDQRGSESDLTRLSEAKLREMYPGWNLQVVTDGRFPKPEAPVAQAEQSATSPVGPEIAKYVLIVALALMLLEVILAWQFGHYSAAAGAQQPAAVGRTAPTVIAIVAGILFAGLAAVSITYAITGDFLDFAPDWLRAAIERWFDVPPPAAGEATQWRLELTRYLAPSLVVGIALAAVVLIGIAYRNEAGARLAGLYKVLLAGLRVFLVLLTLSVLLPQAELHFNRQGWPDIVLLIDDSASMSKIDPYFQDERVREAVKRLGEHMRKRLQEMLPEKIKTLNEKLAATKSADDIRTLEARRKVLEDQLDKANSPTFGATRLQLAQALLAQQENDWLQTLLQDRHMKVHIYHLDGEGRALRLENGELTSADDPQRLKEVHRAVADLEPLAMKSRLASGIRDVLNDYRGASLSAVILLSDGVPVHDPFTLTQASEYAAEKGVPLFFVGIGDEDEIRDLKLHDLVVDDPVYVNDRVIFEARLTGHGYKDLTVPVVLKVKDKTGKEKEVDREMVKVDPSGKSVKFRLRHQPTEVGRKTYVIEIVPPKVDRPEKNPTTPRLERTIEVVDTKLIRILYVEGTPRYEFRFVKSLFEREAFDAKKKRSFELKILLLEGDRDIFRQDQTALSEFPSTMKELSEYDVIIVGDADPRVLGDKNLRMLTDFVRGEDGQGKKTGKTGGGLLMIGGQHFAPHAYRNTPLADVLPIEPSGKAPEEPDDRADSFRLQLTPVGRQHPLFRFTPDDNENQMILQRLQPLFWHAEGFRIKPLAEVLAVHPTIRGAGQPAGQDTRLPLVVQQFVGTGRTMFFGFEESWRWRFREDELRFNQFWVQAMRYLSRNRPTRTTLRLDRQTTPYRVGEPIKVTVQFPDTIAGPGPNAKVGPKSEVKVIVEHRPKADGDGKADPEIQPLQLARIEGSTTNFEALLTRTREGKYRFWLSAPDVSQEDPSGQKPEATATVELPPGELERIRMNQYEMEQAARLTDGGFYTLGNANQLLLDLPEGFRVSLATPKPPHRFWNQWYMLALVLFLLTAEWYLRKRKHLL